MTMNRIQIFIYKSILIFTFLLFTFSCVKEKFSDPEYDITGIWYGSWQGNTDESGTFITDITMDFTDFEGYIYILSDLPSLFNYGIDFDGTISGHEVNTLISVENVLIRAEGELENDSIAEGTFHTSVDIDGNWSCRKIPLNEVEISDSFTYSTNHTISCMTFDGENFWVNPEFEYKLLLLDQEGEVINSFDTDNYYKDMTFSGKYLWCVSYNSDKIIKLDKKGNEIVRIDPPHYFADAIAFDGTYLWCSDGLYRMTYKLDTLGNVLDSLQNPLLPHSVHMEYFDDHLFINCLSKIFKLSLNGTIVSYFDIPGGYPRGMSVYDNSIWYVYQEQYEQGVCCKQTIFYEFRLE